MRLEWLSVALLDPLLNGLAAAVAFSVVTAIAVFAVTAFGKSLERISLHVAAWDIEALQFIGQVTGTRLAPRRRWATFGLWAASLTCVAWLGPPALVLASLVIAMLLCFGTVRHWMQDRSEKLAGIGQSLYRLDLLASYGAPASTKLIDVEVIFARCPRKAENLISPNASARMRKRFVPSCQGCRGSPLFMAAGQRTAAA